MTVCLLLPVLLFAAAAPHAQANAGLQESFRLLSAEKKVAAYEALLCVAGAQRDSRDSDTPAALERQAASQRLHNLLPQLSDPSDPRTLQALREALVADLAAAAAAPLAGRASRLAGALTLVNIAWFVGCILLAVAAFSLVGFYAAALLMLVPKEAWEAAGYTTSAWVLHRATLSSPATAPYVGLTGLLLFTASAGGTIALHGLAERFKGERAAAGLLAFFAAAYGAVAVRLQATLLGTLSVWWAMSALGFSIAVFPFLTVIGFRCGMARPFGAALALLLAFLPFKVAPSALPTPPALRPFEPGVWLWCPMVLNVANLIMSHRRWDAYAGGAPPEVLLQLPLRLRLRLLARGLTQYLAGQLPAVAVIGGTLACGTILDVEQCRAVGAVFGFIWFLSKLAECNWHRVGFAWAALAFGAALWGSAYAAHTWPGLFGLASHPSTAAVAA